MHESEITARLRGWKEGALRRQSLIPAACSLAECGRPDELLPQSVEVET